MRLAGCKRISKIPLSSQNVEHNLETETSPTYKKNLMEHRWHHRNHHSKTPDIRNKF